MRRGTDRTASAARLRSARVLVTGAAGFVGSHVCERLLADGAEVIALDNYITGSPHNLDHLRGHPRLHEVVHDITEPYEPPFAPTVVLHLASLASPAAYTAHPVETMLVGSTGTMHALEIAAANSATFLLTSTSEVYGDPQVHPQPESYRGSVSTVGPRACYDESKRYAEALTMTYARDRGVDVRIVRIFNTYGPRLAPGDGRVVSNFITQALRDQPLTVYGDGSQTRSLCYVADLVEGLVACLLRGDAQPVNLGNPDERSVLELAHVIKRLTGSEAPIAFGPALEDDPKTRCPDIARARATLGWRPRVPLEEGLRRTIDHFDALAAEPPRLAAVRP